MQITKASESHLELLVLAFDAYRVHFGQTSDLIKTSNFLKERFTQNSSTIFIAFDDIENNIDDETACYFCFPRLGTAVALKPGNFLLINALEYHCLSSRCQSDVDIYCVSSYLKTAVVGGNDNKRNLSEHEMACLKAFQNKKT